MKTTLKEVKKGDFFRLTDSDTATVYIKGAYDRSERKFEVTKFDDMNDFKFMNGTRTVYIGFTF